MYPNVQPGMGGISHIEHRTMRGNRHQFEDGQVRACLSRSLPLPQSHCKKQHPQGKVLNYYATVIEHKTRNEGEAVSSSFNHQMRTRKCLLRAWCS